jgi:Polyketide cyclase / dehydrase and lipid transport
MASLRKDIPLNARTDEVWGAVRDFGALHTRLVPGFVLDTRLDGNDARIVTFANGTVLREILIDCDERQQRLAYAVISERVTHYNAAVQVIGDGEARCRLIWTIDFLPHDIAQYIGGQMEQAALAMQKSFPRLG